MLDKDNDTDNDKNNKNGKDKKKDKVKKATIITYRLRFIDSCRLMQDSLSVLVDSPETFKYWVGVQQGHSYLMGRRCLFSLGWPPF